MTSTPTGIYHQAVSTSLFGNLAGARLSKGYHLEWCPIWQYSE